MNPVIAWFLLFAVIQPGDKVEAGLRPVPSREACAEVAQAWVEAAQGAENRTAMCITLSAPGAPA